MALPGAPAPSPVAAGPQAAAPLPPSPSPSSPPTVLMAVRAGLAEPSRLPSLPAASSLRLQLSVQPGTGGRRRFRLGLRGTEAPGGENLIEFNLSDISYRVRSPTCHELRVPTSPEDPVILNFEEEREAQKWWTILSSSLREAQKASETSPAPQASSPPPSSASDPHPEADPASELAEKEDLALQLCEAIECGDEDLAARSAVALARQQAPLRILWRESTYPPDSICMKVGVEDSTSSANITIQVQAHTTIEELKQQIFQDYGFHPLLQRWIIGQCLCVDERTVASYGIRRDGDVAFLYLLSAKAAHLTRQRYEEDQARLLLGSVSSFSSDLGEQSRKYNTCPSRTSSKPAFGNEAGRRLDLAETNQALDSLQLRDLGSPPAAPDPPSPAQGMSPPGDQPQRGAAGGLSLPRRVLRLREPPPGTRDPGGEKLVSPDEYRLFLERSLVLAERRSPNSFHCRTPDCRGWCFYEDSVNEFRCPICQALNCLLCKAIHEGQNCRQYQDDLQARAQDDAAARQTNAMLQTLVQRGDAMRCPGCAVVVQKRDGCDWLRCRLCQTEICWVTKGPRWGPAGPGDTSGGCRCNVSGQRCHPQCHNCH
ncbi:ranBP-type and C3HC4-type zinc finger-containing protein 1-like isoform X1 [Phaenicophaeus curvirostris]|uniref:ranBP-type and C3HC4-type zinc finger-containing protein 1-like isoform X1 n=1 Tax=Phaenicophaeus curvirostris TaxID=33595 RepID=UPI0037F0CAF4